MPLIPPRHATTGLSATGRPFQIDPDAATYTPAELAVMLARVAGEFGFDLSNAKSSYVIKDLSYQAGLVRVVMENDRRNALTMQLFDADIVMHAGVTMWGPNALERTEEMMVNWFRGQQALV